MIWMRRANVRRLLVAGLIPPMAWAAIVALAPTGWARARLAARLTEAARQPATVGSIRLGWLGGVRAKDIRVGDPAVPGGVWLRADEVRVDIGIGSLAMGRCRPTKFRVDGLDLRIHRRLDGTFASGEWLLAAPARSTPSDPRGASDVEVPLAVELGRGRITVVDEPLDTRLVLTGVEGHATRRDHRTAIEDLHGRLNGGLVELVAEVDRSGPVPAIEANVRARGVALDGGLRVLGYFAPALGGPDGAMSGNLDAMVYVRGRGRSGRDVAASLVGQGAIRLDPVRLDGSPFLAELAGAVGPHAAGAKVATIKTDFRISNRRVASENLTLQVAGVPIVLAGWTDFDGRVDYRFRPGTLAGRLSGRAREVLADLSIDVAAPGEVRVAGTLDRPTVTVDGKAPPTGREIEAKLRRVGRQLRRELLR